MAPTLAPGDWALAVAAASPARRRRRGRRTPRPAGLRDGEADRGAPGRSRSGTARSAPTNGGCEGDFAAASTDSRQFGPVSRDELKAKVVLVYWPTDRRRRLSRTGLRRTTDKVDGDAADLHGYAGHAPSVARSFPRGRDVGRRVTAAVRARPRRPTSSALAVGRGSPPASRSSLRCARDPRRRGQPLIRAWEARGRSHEFTFMATHGAEPVRWNPCEPIHYVVNLGSGARRVARRTSQDGGAAALRRRRGSRSPTTGSPTRFPRSDRDLVPARPLRRPLGAGADRLGRSHATTASTSTRTAERLRASPAR